MDIKLITFSDTFIIYKEIQTISDLKKEIKRIGIQTRDIIIYFYDNDSDKVVITQDEDLQYAYQQSKVLNRQTIKFYVYYKLSQPQYQQMGTQIKISIQQPQVDWINQSFQKESSQSIIYHNIYNNNSPLLSRTSTILIPKQSREEKLKSAIDSFIDQILKDEYHI
ncbi:unnamed protein product [Paramecium octaurelia]|uniref:PB1 domain-containing protein n=1 Tax=Paramecium octaurelia TaxID=43137 RepID=A0A8S1UUY9_PAROT|nr:unnamed protein product [Paramecium octaurelia]